MIEAIRIESDEDGWHLIVEGDFSDAVVGGNRIYGPVETTYADHLNICLSQDAAWKLVDEVKSIAEWRAEGESVKADYDRWQETGEFPDWMTEAQKEATLGLGRDIREHRPETADSASAKISGEFENLLGRKLALVVCPSAPRDANIAIFPGQPCPWCNKPIDEHERREL